MSWNMVQIPRRLRVSEWLLASHMDADTGYVCTEHGSFEIYVCDLTTKRPLQVETSLKGAAYNVGLYRDTCPNFFCKGHDRFGSIHRIKGAVEPSFFFQDTVSDGDRVFRLVLGTLTHECRCDEGEILASQIKREAFPDVMTQEMPCPEPRSAYSCKDNPSTSLWNLIQHLNDEHEWTREKIADWLETLDVDLSFPVPETVPKEPGER